MTKKEVICANKLRKGPFKSQNLQCDLSAGQSRIQLFQHKIKGATYRRVYTVLILVLVKQILSDK